MKQYEKTLSKIAPTFFKTIQYHSYFIPYQISSYLHRANVPEKYELTFLPKNINYCFYIHGIRYSKVSYLLEGKTTSDAIVMLTTKDKLPLDNQNFVISLDEFLIDMIINKFRSSLDRYIEKVLIALVGKEMYDTIRTNIK